MQTEGVKRRFCSTRAIYVRGKLGQLQCHSFVSLHEHKQAVHSMLDLTNLTASKAKDQRLFLSPPQATPLPST